MDFADDSLALAEYLSGHGVEGIIIHPYEGAPQQVDAVEYEAAGNRGLPAAKITLRLAQAHGAGVAPEPERMAQTGRDFFQHREVEVDDIPARQHVGINRRDG